MWIVMKIEDNWIDGFLYYVEFQVEIEGLLRIIRKNIVVYEEMETKEIVSLVGENFKNVINIKTVDFQDDILLIKN